MRSDGLQSGIQRVLPALQEEDVKPTDVKERNVLLVYVNKNSEILVGGKRTDISLLKDEVKNFVSNPANDPNMPEKEETEIELIGKFMVSKGVVSLQNDRATPYDMYIQVQNELTRAFHELRDDVSMMKFNKKFMDLDEDQRKAVQKAVPQSISEAEPRNTTGGK